MNLEAALAYAAEGFAVFPLMPGSKQPFPGTRGLLDANTDPEQIRAWWAICPEANIGIAVPDGYAVIDVDPRNGGAETIDALERERGDFPPTRVVRTGGFGLHLWYRLPPGQALPKLGDGVDVQQLGKYVVAPPSLHESGRRYEWIDPSAPIADAPAWLAAKAYPRGERAADVVIDETDMAAPVEELDRIAEAVAPHFERGKRHQIAKNIGGWMKQRGYGAGDVAYVIGRLPSDNPRARTQAALAAFGIQKPFGWTELQALIPEACPELERAPNPQWEARLAERRAAVETIGPLVERMTSAAAPTPPDEPSALAVLGEVCDLRIAPPPLHYVVPDLELAPGRVNLVAGYGNAGKTISTQALAFAVAFGLPVWGRFACRRVRVLWLAYEAIAFVRENFARLAHAHRVSLDELAQWVTVVDARQYLRTAPAAISALRSFGLIVIDTLRAAAGDLDENKPEIAAPLYALGHVSQAIDAAIVLIHHERKPEGTKRSADEHMIAGHHAIHGATQIAISMARDDLTGRIGVRSSKRIRSGFEPFDLRIVDVGRGVPGSPEAIVRAGQPSPGVRVEVAPETDASDARSDAIKDPLLEMLRQKCGARGLNQSTIVSLAKERGWGRDSTIAALGLLETEGAIQTAGTGGRNGKVYRPSGGAAVPFVAPRPEPSAASTLDEFAKAVTPPKVPGI